MPHLRWSMSGRLPRYTLVAFVLLAQLISFTGRYAQAAPNAPALSGPALHIQPQTPTPVDATRTSLPIAHPAAVWPRPRQAQRAARAVGAAHLAATQRPTFYTMADSALGVRPPHGGTLTPPPVGPSGSGGPLPYWIAAGSDDRLWVTEYGYGDVVAMTTNGAAFTYYALPTSGGEPLGIAAGPDGNLWVAEFTGNKIARITTKGVVTEFAVPTKGGQPYGVAAGPDGNLWFTETGGNKIGRITTSGAIAEYRIPTKSSGAEGIAAGPDGNLWFTESVAGKIGRISTAGAISEFALPSAGSQPLGISGEADGNVWFAEFAGNAVARITPAGTITEYSMPQTGSYPAGVAQGPDQGVWITEYGVGDVLRVDPATLAKVQYTNPNATSSGPIGICSGADGNMHTVNFANDTFGTVLLPSGTGVVPSHGAVSVRFAAGLSARVDLYDGHVDVQAGDLAIPARGPGLQLAHTWDSGRALAGQATAAGQGWFTDLTPSMSGALTGTVVYQDETGAVWGFNYQGKSTDPGPSYTSYSTPLGRPWQLSTSATGATRYTLANILTGETRTFDQGGSLVADADSYGNADTLSPSGGAAASETNGGGRALAFSYQNGLLHDVTSPLWRSSGGTSTAAGAYGQHVQYSYTGTQLTGITWGQGTGDAQAAAFGYDGNGLLTGVTTPGGHRWALGYDGYGRLVGITSPISGTDPAQPGYTPAITTQFNYPSDPNSLFPRAESVVEGYGSTQPLTTSYQIDILGEVTQAQDGLSDTTSYVYDKDHDATSVTDPNYNRTTGTYYYVGPLGSTGLISQTVGPPVGVNSLPPNATSVQVTTNYSYDGANNLIEAHRLSNGGLGEQDTHYAYDAHHGLLSSSELIGTSSSGGAGCTSAATAPGGMAPAIQLAMAGTCTISYQWRCGLNQYDSYGQVVYSTDGRGTIASGSDPSGACSAGAAAAQHRGAYTYDGFGDRTAAGTPPITTSPSTGGVASTQPVTTTASFDDDGEATTVTSPNGALTITSYDHLGRPVAVTQPGVTLADGSTTTPTSTIGYDGDGNVAQRADADGNVSRDSYDPLGRLVSRTDPVGGTTVLTYTATALAAATDPRGGTSRRFYDAAGRLSKAVDPLGNYTTYGYDNDGNLQTATAYDAGGTQLSQDSRQYDSMGWVTGDTRSGLNLPQPEQTQYAYDIDGHPVLQQDPNGEIHQLFYDGVGQRTDTTISDSNLNVLNDEQATYDLAGNLYATVGLDGQGHTATLDGADRAGQLVDTTASGTAAITTTATFDPDGNVLTRGVTQAGVGTAAAPDTAAYNAADWLTGATEDGLATAYGYDAAGQPVGTSLVTVTSPLRATLDGLGRPMALAESVGGTAPYTGTFGYDGDSNLTDVGLPDGAALHLTYDADNRLTALADLGSQTDAYGYGYDGLGRTVAVTSTVGGATAMTPYTHDALGRLYTAGADQYTYRPDGNLGAVVAGTTTISYTYANAGQPDELTGLATTGQPALSFAYDTGLTHTVGLTGTATDSGGYLTVASTDGNLGADCQAGQVDPNSTCLAYDTRGRLQSATMPDGTAVALAYDAAGRRASYSVTPRGAGQPSLVEAFAYRGGALGQVAYTGTGVTTPYTDTFVYRPDGAPYELLRQQGGSTSRYWYETDGHGDVVALVDPSGAVVDRYRYDAWGAPSIATEAVPQPLLYAGYWYDRELRLPGEATGWYWLSSRSYDPALKRFLQPDPSGQEGVRSYVYCGDDPLDCADPSGLLGWGDVFAGLAIGIGTVAALALAPETAGGSLAAEGGLLGGFVDASAGAGLAAGGGFVDASAGAGLAASGGFVDAAAGAGLGGGGGFVDAATGGFAQTLVNRGLQAGTAAAIGYGGAQILTAKQAGVYRLVGTVNGVPNVTVRTGKTRDLDKRKNQYANNSPTVQNQRMRALQAQWDAGDQSIDPNLGHYTFERLYEGINSKEALAGVEEHAYETYGGSSCVFNAIRPYSTDRKFGQMDANRDAGREWLMQNAGEVYWCDTLDE